MNSWNQGGIVNNNSGQRIMSSQQRVGLPNTTPYNANYPQNFYRPPNGQQFYSSQGTVQGHAGYISSQVYQGHMSSVPQHFRPATPPAQPFKQMTQAEQEDFRKKKNFEDQQRRLLALKQKGGLKTQTDNPLKDLFGKKGSSFDTSSLLRSLGNTTRSKGLDTDFEGNKIKKPVKIAKVEENGSVTYGHLTSGFPGASTDFQSSSLPVWNLQGSDVHPQTSGSLGSGNLQDFKDFTAEKHLQDDFGDFQQSAVNQSFATVDRPLPWTSSSIPNTSAVITVNQNMPVSSFGVLDSSTSTTTDNNRMNKEENVLQATVPPSIEDLMKKSLILDKQSQSSVMKFQKPKLPKLIKSQPSHFSESSKASKWDNLESLSEMFTIPQPAVVQQEPVNNNQSQLIVDSGDDWSEFSAADQGGVMFQQQCIQGFAQGSLDHTQTKFEYVSSDNKVKGLQGNEKVQGIPAGLLNSAVQMVPTVCKPIGEPGTQGLSGLDMMPGTQNIQISQAMKGGDVVKSDEVLPEGTVHVQDQSQGRTVQEIGQELTPTPEQQIYGVQLPGWSQETTMLPAVYKQIEQMCSNGSSSISTSQLYPILLLSDLPREKLGHIWSQCNKAVLGQLNQQELYLILGMVALAQAGLQVNKLTLEKLASCKTAPIPSFPEKIFQNDGNSRYNSPPLQTSVQNETILEDNRAYNSETGAVLDVSLDSTILKHSSLAVNVVKQPDWSKWKTSKAGHADDKFADFQVLIPKERSASFQGLGSAAIPNLNINTTSVTSDSMDSFGSFQTSAVEVQAPLSSDLELTHNPLNICMSRTAFSSSSSVSAASENPSIGEVSSPRTQRSTTDAILNKNLLQSFSSADTNINTANTLGDFTNTSGSVQEPQMNAMENKNPPSSAHFMSAPLQVSKRYALSGEEESVDHHEKAWLKCLTSCFKVIVKSCQILQTISDPSLQKEIFSSPQGISHFSAIIEIYCVSQRIKASVLNSAPSNKKLKESLQNIDNVWKTYLGFQSFKELLPTQSLNFSGCHVNEDEDLNLTCGLCLLNVDKSWVYSLVNKGHSGKLSYGSRFYHTTCANFWCNKVDSVLPALQLNVGNSLI